MNRIDNIKELEKIIRKELVKEWKVDTEKLNEIFDKYDLSKYIAVCYEKFNSMGNKGIIEDLEEYMKLQDEVLNIAT